MLGGVGYAFGTMPDRLALAPAFERLQPAPGPFFAAERLCRQRRPRTLPGSHWVLGLVFWRASRERRDVSLATAAWVAYRLAARDRRAPCCSGSVALALGAGTLGGRFPA